MANFSRTWTTENIADLEKDIRTGGDNVDLSCFYEGDPELRKAKTRFKISAAEQDEFNKCAVDVNYFVSKYCKFLTDEGKKTVQLRDYQSDVLETFSEEEYLEKIDDFAPKERNIIWMASRQIGKTTTVSAFFAWYLCFHNDRNLLIIANKQATTTEIVRKVIDVFRGLPYFLKPGIHNIGKLGLILDNGCMLSSQATTKTASIGFTIHLLYIDEFAHIPNNISKSLWRSVYPTLSSSDVSQCIITSTPNGMTNLFFDIWDKSTKGKNSFVNKRTDYWEVEGRDEAWVEKMRRDFGEEEFAQEYELSFDSQANLLLNIDQLKWLNKIHSKFVYKDLENSTLDEELYKDKLLWHKDFDPNAGFDENEFRFILANDIAEGKDIEEVKDNDFNITNIFSVELKSLAKLRTLRKDEHTIKNLFRINQVGIYRDNIDDEEIMAKINQTVIFEHLGTEICKLVTEMNFNGKSFLQKLSTHDEFYDDLMMHSYHTAPIPGEKPPRKKPGYKTRSDKNYFVKLGRKLIKAKTLIPKDKTSYEEFGSFGKVKNTYKGIAKHDDTVMATLNISRFYEEDEYSEWLEDFLENLPMSPAKKFAMEIIKEPYDENEIDDGLFKAMHDHNDVAYDESALLKQVFG